MLETEKGRRMDQILATGVTREELAEALWCAESSVRMWNECADALRNENAELRKELRDVYALHWHGLDCTECPWFDECDTDGGCPWLGIMHEHMRELRVEVNV